MNLQQAIQQQYGVRVPVGAQDGVRRVFKIDQLRNGYLLHFPEGAFFGSVIDGEIFTFDGREVWGQQSIHKSNKKINAEWLVWEAARSMLERGDRLNAEDSERLALAVQRLEMWL